MARPVARTDDTRIDQLDPLEDGGDRSTIVEADNSVLDKEYLERIAFMEEPVTIQITAAGGENPVSHYLVACNGKGAEVLMDNRWISITWLPVDTEITIKRKYLSILAGAKTMSVRTEIKDRSSDNPINMTHRPVTGLANIDVLQDHSPRGRAWLAEVRRRNF